MEKILTAVEIANVKKFMDNEAQVNAVKKVLLAGIYHNGTFKKGEKANFKRNFALNLVFDQKGGELSQTNEQLGARLKACVEALRFLEGGFQLLENLCVSEEPKEISNGHR